MPDLYRPSDWYWLVGDDKDRWYSSAAASYVDKLPAGAGVTRIASESELWDVLRAQFPDGLPAGAVPPEVHIAYLRLALAEIGRLDAVNAAVQSAGVAYQQLWDYATTIQRTDAEVVAIGRALGVDLDAVFSRADEIRRARGQ